MLRAPPTQVLSWRPSLHAPPPMLCCAALHCAVCRPQVQVILNLVGSRGCLTTVGDPKQVTRGPAAACCALVPLNRAAGLFISLWNNGQLR